MSKARRGFSLAELLMAVFILGIGIIAIAALFPAGIAQQRQSTDDILGALVAENAVSILRTKLRPEHFGFGSTSLDGDFRWSRPAFFRRGTTIPAETGSVDVTAGSVSVFDDTLSNTTESELDGDDPRQGDWNREIFGNEPPTIIISQEDRYYPMVSTQAAVPPSNPQYVWDFMVRRFQGKVLVAVFVYRVTIPGGDNVRWNVPQLSGFNDPPLPIWLDLENTSGPYPWWRPWSADGDDAAAGIQPATRIPNTGPSSDPATYNPLDHRESWQAPSQWILDQNNTVHRVLSGRRTAADGPVELTRPVPVMPFLFPNGGGYLFGDGDQNVRKAVTDLFYIPIEVRLDTNGDGTPDQLPATLTPVHVAVKEL